MFNMIMLAMVLTVILFLTILFGMARWSDNVKNMANLMAESEKMSRMLFGDTKPYTPLPYFKGQITMVEAGVVEPISTNLALNLLMSGFVGMAIKLVNLIIHQAEDAVTDICSNEGADGENFLHIEISAVEPTTGTLLGYNDPRVLFRDQFSWRTLFTGAVVNLEIMRVPGRFTWSVPNALVVTNTMYIHLEGAALQTNVLDYRFNYDLKPIQFAGLGQALTTSGLLFNS
jgi:hypothetical protein